jgi:hypothetical protein
MRLNNTFARAHIGFAGIVWDMDHQAHDVFKIERAGENTVYGGYYYVFAPDRFLRRFWIFRQLPNWITKSSDDNKDDFKIEIGRFGYPGELDVGNPNPTLRHQFAEDECRAIQELIRAFFSDSNTFADSILASAKCASVNFRADWIIQKSADPME